MSIDKVESYAVKHKSYNVRRKSMSGGIFSLISDLILKNHGSVYGCILDEEFNAVFARAINEKERDKMCGSKYIQSDMRNAYVDVKNDLEQGKWVLFTGTSCQVDGLFGYLGKKYENLLCLDILCHGVPSAKIWKEYIKWQEDGINAKCIQAAFRNKKDFGWTAHIYELLKLQKPDGQVININSGVFRNLFYSNLALRPACYECPYKSKMHPGDITIGDFWKIDRVFPDFSDDMGVSLVLVNTTAGKKIFEKCKSQTEYRKCDINDCLQPSLIAPSKRPEEREQFWRDYTNESFEYIANKYGKGQSEKECNIDKYRIYYDTLLKCLEMKQNNQDILKYFDERNIKNVAIYGLGRIGIFLYNELKQKSINVIEIIDQNERMEYDGIPVKKVGEKLCEKTEMIIVTPIFAYEKIKENLLKYVECEIVSLQEIIYCSEMIEK